MRSSRRRESAFARSRSRIRISAGRRARYSAVVIRFYPPPGAGDCPTRFPTPFDRAATHPLARRAAMELMYTLQTRDGARWRLRDAGNGKMFGVLVVAADDGTVGY